MSGSSLNKAIALVPFGYYAVTRGTQAKELAFLVATSWLPAIWILFRLGPLGIGSAILTFAIGYFAFIAIYELGYLVNDSWDAARSPEGRKRLPFRAGAIYAGAFVLVRVLVWAAIGIGTGWLYDWTWVAGYAALALAFAQHNVITSPSLRITSFFELSIFRFALPVIGAIDGSHYLEVAMAAVLFYSYLRFLGYAESKGVLLMPERRLPAFGLKQTLMIAPLVAWLALLARSSLLIELFAYFALVRAIWTIAQTDRSRGAGR